MAERVNVCLVAGGLYHDIDFARLELLKLLAEHEHVRVTVLADYENTAPIIAGSVLISYTCDVRPSERAQSAIRSWVEGGGRWFALHGTNSALDLSGPNGVEAPRVFPSWAETLGSQFVAHPPIQPYLVEVSAPDSWLVAGVTSFSTNDELYLCEHHDRASLQPLLHTVWAGEATGFAEADWSAAARGTDEHLVMYLRDLGAGAVLYNTLGHCRGHYDMVPRMAYYPKIEQGSWAEPQYYELLRRGIRWTLGHTS